MTEPSETFGTIFKRIAEGGLYDLLSASRYNGLLVGHWQVNRD